MVADLLNIRIGNSFSGGLIDFLIFGVFQGNAHTNWFLVLPVGMIWFGIYYIVFRFCVSKFRVAVPGMIDSDEIDESFNTTNNTSLHELSQKIIIALGDVDNIEDVTACATRLRVSLKDSQLVDKNFLTSIGATAVLDVKNGIQAIYGGKAILYSQEINQILGKDEL